MLIFVDAKGVLKEKVADRRWVGNVINHLRSINLEATVKYHDRLNRYLATDPCGILQTGRQSISVQTNDDWGRLPSSTDSDEDNLSAAFLPVATTTGNRPQLGGESDNDTGGDTAGIAILPSATLPRDDDAETLVGNDDDATPARGHQFVIQGLGSRSDFRVATPEPLVLVGFYDEDGDVEVEAVEQETATEVTRGDFDNMEW